MRGLPLILLALLPIKAALADINEAIVTGGTVSGTAENGISMFKGIPFAAPPVGELRVESARPRQVLVWRQEGRCFRQGLHAGTEYPGQHRARQ